MHNCIHWLNPRNSPPPPCIWAHIRGRYWSAKIDNISLWPPGVTYGDVDTVSKFAASVIDAGSKFAIRVKDRQCLRIIKINGANGTIEGHDEDDKWKKWKILWQCPFRDGSMHRVGRVPSILQSSENLLPRRRVCPPALWFGHTRLRERGWGSPNSDDIHIHYGMELLLLFMYRRPILCTLYGAVDFLNVLKITINVPVVFMALYVMILRGALLVPFQGPKKSRFSGLRPFQCPE